MDKLKALWAKQWVRYTIAIIIIILLLSWAITNQYNIWQANKAMNQLKHNLEIANQQVKYEKNRAGELSATVETFRLQSDQIEAFSQELKKDMEKFAKSVKSIETYTKVVTITRDSIQIKHDSIQMTRNDTVIKELPFAYTDSFMNIDGKVTPTGVGIKYQIKSSLEIAYVWKKQGLGIFRKPKLETIVTAKNPNEIVTNITAFQTQPPPKKWYQTKGFAFGSGFVIGSGLMTTLYFLTHR